MCEMSDIVTVTSAVRSSKYCALIIISHIYLLFKYETCRNIAYYMLYSIICETCIKNGEVNYFILCNLLSHGKMLIIYRPY